MRHIPSCCAVPLSRLAPLRLCQWMVCLLTSPRGMPLAMAICCVWKDSSSAVTVSEGKFTVLKGHTQDRMHTARAHAENDLAPA